MGIGDLDLAQALADVSKGEMTATALENHLSALESKIDEVLAAFGEDMPQDLSNGDNAPGIEKEEKETETEDTQGRGVTSEKSSH
ncbi:hypothetical protein N7456_013272 [Penicillium angulare]|uniref:Uncharacterized protein n=1 Tax=Penicillium angulare TaxID=116970 RepID=A0A9W9ELE3_9EURO|nr:hypothetical protein N7456_013272 [Penicillium angulare]